MVYQGQDGERSFAARDNAMVDVIVKYADSYALELDTGDPRSIYWEPFEEPFDGRDTVSVELSRKGREYVHRFVFVEPDSVPLEALATVTIRLLSEIDTSHRASEEPVERVIGSGDSIAASDTLSVWWPQPLFASDTIRESTKFSITVPEGLNLRIAAENDSLDRFVIVNRDGENRGSIGLTLTAPLETIYIHPEPAAP